ncbi:hypothetical protein P8452_02049 [Trifolium repens]|nr:hypothetical protein P8452_02049 [Trifolium repens]
MVIRCSSSVSDNVFDDWFDSKTQLEYYFSLTCLAIDQVTKLCDLGVDVCVCSVGWAQRGTHLAVGTNNGVLELHVSS